MLCSLVKLDWHYRPASYPLSFHSLPKTSDLRSFFSHSYLLPKFPPLVFNHLQTQGGRGEGIQTALGLHFPLLRMTEDGPRTSAPLSLLESILTKSAPLSPLESILTKNRGRGDGQVFSMERLGPKKARGWKAEGLRIELQGQNCRRSTFLSNGGRQTASDKQKHNVPNGWWRRASYRKLKTYDCLSPKCSATVPPVQSRNSTFIYPVRSISSASSFGRKNRSTDDGK